jgi:hypothetical protein
MATPIASLKRLEALGLDRALYGSCAEPDQRSIQGRGKVWITRGCDQWNECPWKHGTELMKPRDAADVLPRPRNVVTKFIKPNPNGPGDRVINSYCACHQFLSGPKRRDGRNNEIAEVVGGEGDTVRLKMSKRNTKTDGSIYFTPEIRPTVVPIFPDPTEVEELFEDVEAGRDRIENKQRTVDAERARRLGHGGGMEGVAIGDNLKPEGVPDG